MKKFLLISDTHNKHLKIPKEYRDDLSLFWLF